MNGPFDGPLSRADGVAGEALPAPLAAALAAARTYAWTRPADGAPDAAAVAFFTVDPAAIVGRRAGAWRSAASTHAASAPTGPSAYGRRPTWPSGAWPESAAYVAAARP